MNWKYRVAVAKDFKGNSKQYFLFQSLDAFIQHLDHTGEKWFYEIIGGNQESCMYLDLEWYHDCGEFDSPEEILKVLLQEYQEFMKSKFDIVVEPNTWKILSSHGTLIGNIVKYSFHLIDRSGLTLIDHNHRKLLVPFSQFF
jgi:hypothetical protein